MAIWVADKQMVGIVALAWQKSEQTSIAKIVVISRVWSSCLKSRKEEERVHEEDKRNIDERVLTTRHYWNQPEEANTGKEAHNIVNNQHLNMAWCTNEYDACPV